MSLKEVLVHETDTTQLSSDLDKLKDSKKRINVAKMKLESQMDNLDVYDEYYYQKYDDFQRRLDGFYSLMSSIDTDIEKTNRVIEAAKCDQISADMIIKFVEAVKDEFDIMPYELEKKVMNFFCDRVELFEERQADGRYVKSIHFRFTVLYKCFETQEIGWDMRKHVESVVLLTH